ncbi:MAG TPA: ChbG/HpnK family deacetylase [Candidatus Saccharimonadales bacterium]|nr:ChbG/HpnK family deacetylase [Candidatus Saccharimonadales bacterium]
MSPAAPSGGAGRSRLREALRGARVERRLLWSADDFGLSGPVNEGIVLAHRQGRVRNASLLAGGAAFEEAVRLARGLPSLCLGVHLAAVEQRAVLPPERNPGLTSPDGRLPAGHRQFLARYLAGRIRAAAVEAEWEAQIARVRDAGLTPEYLDSHQHLHVLPGLFEATVRLARRFGVRAVRTPGDVVPGRCGPVRRVLLMGLFRLGRRARAAARRERLFSPDGTLGVAEAGRITAARIRAWLPWLLLRGAGTVELVSHPGMGEPQGSPAAAWGYRWAEELAAARDEELAGDLQRAGVIVAGYRECLAPSP